MMTIKTKYDFGHVAIPSPFLRATDEERMVTNSTMLILLAGIRIAAIMGESVPCTAKDKNPRYCTEWIR